MSGTPTETDLWFREGIIVPEPGSVWLALVAALLAWLRIRLGAAMRCGERRHHAPVAIDASRAPGR